LIVGFSENGWNDYLFWQKTDKKILKRVNLLISDIKRNPFNNKGLGKLEKLKDGLNRFFSRRITAEHRLVYIISDQTIIIRLLA
jgi:toxin YoeB